MTSRADYWKKLLWEATLSTDSELVEDRHETAASSALASTSYRRLQRLAEVSDDGLKRLQPELRRAQQRVLLIHVLQRVEKEAQFHEGDADRKPSKRVQERWRLLLLSRDRRSVT